ncbi:helix-turn-helix transcriptional regulator [Thermopolyspora sp. NPDC052614]|uniref:helix-turn-helix domain-containing protein n=1 Tax=Thermopolyspora sp. NPDC052614 TaxID=3155682 RepID=UPI00341AEF71
MKDQTVDKYSPQSIWGRELRHYRLAAGLTQSQLAERIHFSLSTVSAAETGANPATLEFATQCDKALDTGGALVRLLDWRKAERFPAWFGKWHQIEQEAITLRWYEPLVVPGLLQTQAYARAILLGNQELVNARLDRQAVLHREEPAPPVLRCVIDEGILHRPVGGPEVMREQLLHLVSAVSPRLSIQVIPLGAYDGLLGGLIIATLPGGQEVTYVETAVRGLTTSEPEDVAKAEERFEIFRTEALPVGMSVELIKRTVEERWT